ncbi:MFS transporter [Sphingobium amiense]|uniref:MFS transporter n=1 Tax=Sphingobium amiense TaxID=135719 RepID=A0A494W6A4_9SPHN|nr:MFS transporter [Sphingobium amiense]BBD98087.1 MFS transporter [Sphingobium amiense]
MNGDAALPTSAPRAIGVLPVMSIVLTGLASAAIIVAMPGLLAGMSTTIGLTDSQIALITSSEMVGTTATTLFVAAWLSRIDRRKAALVGLVLILSVNLLSAYATAFTTLIVARFIAGLAAGALQGILSASIAATPIPDRIFAIYLTANLTATTVMLALLSQLNAIGHPQWLFMSVVTLATLAILLLRWLPAGVAAHRPTDAKGAKPARGYGLSALLGTFILLIGVGLTWPLVGVLGLDRAMSGEAVARALSFATVGGIAASVLVSAMGDRAGRRLPISAGAAGLCIAVLIFMLDGGRASFTAAAFVYMFCWILILPYCAGLVATLDPSGRLSVLWVTMQFAGLAIGPIIAAGLLLSSADLPFYGSLICFGIAAALTLYAERGSRSAPAILENGSS